MAGPASSHRYISVSPDIASSDRMAFCHHSLAPTVVVHLSFDVGYFQHLDDPDSRPQPESNHICSLSFLLFFCFCIRTFPGAFATWQRHRSESQSSRLPT